MSAARKAPAGLRKSGKALWLSITDGVTLRPDELAVLESAARIVDQIDELEDAMSDQPLMTMGSRGQQIVHPLVTETRAQRAELARQLARLDVPEADGDVSRRTKNRRNANARWH